MFEFGRLSGRDFAAIEPFKGDSQWSEAQWLHSLQSEICYGLRKQNALVGLAVFQQGFDDISLLNIISHPEHRGQGIARRLLRSSLLDLPSLRCLLEVRESNTVAIKLYEAMGFQRDGLRKNYYLSSEGRENAVLMSRPASDGDKPLD